MGASDRVGNSNSDSDNGSSECENTRTSSRPDVTKATEEQDRYAHSSASEHVPEGSIISSNSHSETYIVTKHEHESEDAHGSEPETLESEDSVEHEDYGEET